MRDDARAITGGFRFSLGLLCVYYMLITHIEEKRTDFCGLIARLFTFNRTGEAIISIAVIFSEYNDLEFTIPLSVLCLVFLACTAIRFFSWLFLHSEACF